MKHKQNILKSDVKKSEGYLTSNIFRVGGNQMAGEEGESDYKFDSFAGNQKPKVI